MNPILLLASDLDGTLFNSRSEISRENLAAIHELTERGVHFVPSTGRTLGELPAELLENSDIRYIIHSNGAVIFDKQTKGRICNGVKNELLPFVFSVLSRFQLHLTIRYAGKTYFDAAKNTPEDFQFYNLCKEHIAILKTHAIAKENFVAWASTLDDIEQITSFFHDADEMKEAMRLLSAEPRLRVAISADYNVEVFSSEAGKGKALLHLADLLEIPHQSTAAVGDSGNDLTIIRAAGTGFAVSNSCKELMAAADTVICSNDEHAIRYILTHYFSTQ